MDANATLSPHDGPRNGRDFIARHGETVFNAAKRLQGDAPHTPLTHAGFAQAHEMGRALREELGAKPALTTAWVRFSLGLLGHGRNY